MSMLLTPDQEDAIKELFNIGAGHAAGALSELTNSHIELTVPSIRVVKLADLESGTEILGKGVYSSVRMHFTGFMNGSAALVFPPDSALKLIATVTEDTSVTPDMDSLKAGVLTEIGNIIITQVLSVISNTFQKRLEYSVPSYFEGRLVNLIETSDPSAELVILIIDTKFTIKDLQIAGDVVLFFELGELDSFVELVEGCLG